MVTIFHKKVKPTVTMVTELYFVSYVVSTFVYSLVFGEARDQISSFSLYSEELYI